MTLKILQLNTWGGRLFPNIKNFLQKNDFDILFFQEVANFRSNDFAVKDEFKSLQEVLGENYIGQKATHTKYVPESIFYNLSDVIFYKKEFKLLDSKMYWLYKRSTPWPVGRTTFEDFARSFLSLKLEKDNYIFNAICAHLAWAPDPTERSYQRKQNLKLIEYIKNLKNPFVLAGDFNLIPNEPTVLDLEKYGLDLTKQYNVKNTLSRRYHKSWDKIKPGFPVDYIFVSPNAKVNDFRVLDDLDLSDHYGLTANLSF